MSNWLTNPELFLYAKGPDDVILQRCKKLVSSSSSGSSLVVPMKSDDFEYVSNVENHLELIGYMSAWEESDYKRLVKYIYEKRLLVNGQGLVIVELLHKVDKDGKNTIDDAANEEDVPAIYIRSLDVLPLNSYIPKLNELPIPFRTVKYLGDVNGKAAMIEEDPNVTKLTARVEKLEAENTKLESKNNTLDTSVTQLTASLATITGNVVDLQSKNKTIEAEYKTLEGKVTKLAADLVTQMNALTTLQRESNKQINVNTKEIWMNDLTNSRWVGIEGVQGNERFEDFVILGQLGTFTVDDLSTNVRAIYWYKIIAFPGTTHEYKAISIEDLIPNKEKARFLYPEWYAFTRSGKKYVYRSVSRELK